VGSVIAGVVLIWWASKKPSVQPQEAAEKAA